MRHFTGESKDSQSIGMTSKRGNYLDHKQLHKSDTTTLEGSSGPAESNIRYRFLEFQEGEFNILEDFSYMSSHSFWKPQEVIGPFEILEWVGKVSYHLVLCIGRSAQYLSCFIVEAIYMRQDSYCGSFKTRYLVESSLSKIASNPYRPYGEDIRKQGDSASAGFVKSSVDTRSNVGTREHPRVVLASLQLKI